MYEMARETLSRDRIMRGALAVADAGGLAALTIRSLATELGVKPMAVYHYVANKDEILDGLVDLVFARDRAARSRPARGATRSPAGWARRARRSAGIRGRSR